MDGTLATHVQVYCTTSRARGDQWTRFPILPQHSPPCHEIREPQPRVHVVDRPEPTSHARNPKNKLPGEQSKATLCVLRTLSSSHWPT